MWKILTDQDHKRTIPTNVSGGRRFQPTRSVVRANLVLNAMPGDGNAGVACAELSEGERDIFRSTGPAVSCPALVCDIYPSTLWRQHQSRAAVTKLERYSNKGSVAIGCPHSPTPCPLVGTGGESVHVARVI